MFGFTLPIKQLDLGHQVHIYIMRKLIMGRDLDIIPQKGDWNFIMPMDLYDSPVTYPHRGVIL